MEGNEDNMEEENENRNDDDNTVDTNDTDNNLIEPYRIPFDNDNSDEEYDDMDDGNISKIQNEDTPDSFEDLLTNSVEDDLFYNDIEEQDLNNQETPTIIPTTDSGEIANEIEETTIYGGTQDKLTISGHVILNQCGSLLTRKKHELKGSSKHKFFLQKIVATSAGSSVPLMYPEGILFPSIHWKMADDGCSIIGCIPAPLLSDTIQHTGFASIHSHVKCRLTNSSSSTSTNTNYIAHTYDMLTNITANHLARIT